MCCCRTNKFSYKNNNSLAEWLKFDISLLENFAWESFSTIADKTRIELAKIENQANTYHPYHSHEITGPGTFHCDQCHKQISFKSTSKIPECPDCKEKTSPAVDITGRLPNNAGFI